MTKYTLKSQEFYSDLFCEGQPLTKNNYPGAADVKLCKVQIENLVNRYSLFKKSCLSIGSGIAAEEYWFHKHECALTLIDIDENEFFDIESYIKEKPSTLNGDLTFFIDSADSALKETSDNFYDFLFVSGFHPDEVRREEIQEKFKLHRTSEEAYHHLTWPTDASPYLDTLVDAFAKIRRNGLVIFQHYKGGVSLQSNPHYLSSLISQFEENGVTLLEVYAYKQSSQHLLVVGFKGTYQQACNFSSACLLDRVEIKTFHGRYPNEEIKNNVVKVYDILNPHVNINSAYPKQENLAKPTENNFIKRLINTFTMKK